MLQCSASSIRYKCIDVGPAITLTQIVYESSTNCKADLAASIAKNKTLLEEETPVVITYTQK